MANYLELPHGPTTLQRFDPSQARTPSKEGRRGSSCKDMLWEPPTRACRLSADGGNKWLIMVIAAYLKSSKMGFNLMNSHKTCLGGSSSVLQVSDSVTNKSVLNRCESADMT